MHFGNPCGLPFRLARLALQGETHEEVSIFRRNPRGSSFRSNRLCSAVREATVFQRHQSTATVFQRHQSQTSSSGSDVNIWDVVFVDYGRAWIVGFIEKVEASREVFS